ncbi:GNAT family N-acetyltransferase [Sphingomonas turrisvirgatae]|uniref:GNAT family N-acetyltransferase n=1 Tax=Sphingomonas turrisvirgatae TaxID=1888892 RepID=UPI0009A221EF|nr:GNAT family N-acetyltransferase [Sphingomonas turrisvirgatae]
MSGPILFTERLILRRPVGEDFEAWAAFSADPETMEHLGGAVERSVAWRQMCTTAGAWDVKGFSMFSVIERASGRWVGRLGPWQPEGWPGTEIGWGVAHGFAGKGYAYEGAVAAMDYAVDVLGWDRVIHTIAPGNVRSRRLAQRLGSTNGGPTQLPAPLGAMQVDAWGQSATEWRENRARR